MAASSISATAAAPREIMTARYYTQAMVTGLVQIKESFFSLILPFMGYLHCERIAAVDYMGLLLFIT